jgi:exonuclease III
MLHDFCSIHDIDILLLQEVTHTNFESILYRNKYFNIGPERRGTAIITKEHITLENVNKLPSGRGIAGWYEGLYIINIYAPSGSGRRKDRDNFYMNDLLILLQHATHDYIIGGDFNCVLQREDCTGLPVISMPLSTLVRQCHLKDAWNMAYGAVRIDRIYMSGTVGTRKYTRQRWPLPSLITMP